MKLKKTVNLIIKTIVMLVIVSTTISLTAYASDYNFIATASQGASVNDTWFYGESKNIDDPGSVQLKIMFTPGMFNYNPVAQAITSNGPYNLSTAIRPYTLLLIKNYILPRVSAPTIDCDSGDLQYFSSLKTYMLLYSIQADLTPIAIALQAKRAGELDFGGNTRWANLEAFDPLAYKAAWVDTNPARVVADWQTPWQAQNSPPKFIWSLITGIQPATYVRYAHVAVKLVTGKTNYAVVTIPADAQYRIKYNLNGGTGSIGDTVAWSKELTNISLQTPTRTGYKFLYWTTNQNGTGTKFYPNGSIDYNTVKLFGSDTLTLHAQWQAEEYTVKFSGNGATSGLMGDQKIMYNVLTPLNKNQFNRQFTVTYDPNGGVTTGTSGTISLTFKNWKAGNNYYNDQQSVYNITGPGLTITLSAQWQDQTITLPNATREYYTFLGWYVDNTRIGGAGDKLLINKNYLLKAKWVPLQVLTVDPNGGDWLDKYPIVIGQYSQLAEIDKGPTNKTYKNKVSFPMGPDDQKKIEDAIRRGYNFYGWEIDSMGKPQ